MALLLPWTVEEYPGRLRALASMCGVRPRTVEDWLYRPKMLPRKQARRLASLVRERIADLSEVAAELEAWADRPLDEVAQRQGIKRRGRGG